MIYLDHAATTPLAPEALEAMLPWLRDRFGNPSSIHQWGREARAALDHARDQIAAALGADYAEIIFTSSGTEADNLALQGVMQAAPPGRRHLVVSAIEHPAVMATARALEAQGFPFTVVPVDGQGFVDPDQLAASVRDDTALVSVLHASNEIGAIQDIPLLAAAAHARGALFHTDAVQSFGSLPVNVRDLGVDLLTVSAHKLYGPKGVGALWVRAGVPLIPCIRGGTQERERRAGTENVAGIVGFAAAAALAMEQREEESARLVRLRDGFIARLEERIEGIRLNGPRTRRLPNNVNVAISGVDGAAALLSLDRAGIAASSGSACSSGAIEPSPVLQAIGLPPQLAASGIRFTLGRSTKEADLEQAAEALAGIVDRLRGAE